MSDTDCQRCVTVTDGTKYLCEEHRLNASGIDWEETARRRERNVFGIVFRDGTTDPGLDTSPGVDERGNPIEPGFWHNCAHPCGVLGCIGHGARLGGAVLT